MKSILSSLCLAVVLSIVSIPPYSAGTPLSNEPASISQQIHNYLQGMDLSQLDAEKEVLVDFIVNIKGEIMILSTNNDDLDARIKNRLNYKKLSNNNLKHNRTYTINVLFKNQ